MIEPASSNLAKRNRRWWSVHWLACLAVIVEGAAIAHCEFFDQFLVLEASSFSYVKLSRFGWPVADLEQVESGTWFGSARSPTFEYTWYLPSLAANCAFCLLLVCSVGLAVEFWLRKPKRWQFTLRGLALLFAVTGAMLTAIKHQSLIDNGLSRLGMEPGLKLFQPFGIDLDSASSIVIQCGLVCLV
jgi:hypothetical protein